MWIMTNQGMLSIVQHRTYQTVMIVRARNREPLDRHFPDFEPIEMRLADYRWRVIVPRPAVAEVLAKLVADITYANFKDSVQDRDLHDAYLTCWGAMYRYQDIVHGEPGEPDEDLYCEVESRDLMEESYPPGWPIGGITINGESEFKERRDKHLDAVQTRVRR